MPASGSEDGTLARVRVRVRVRARIWVGVRARARVRVRVIVSQRLGGRHAPPVGP